MAMVGTKTLLRKADELGRHNLGDRAQWAIMIRLTVSYSSKQYVNMVKKILSKEKFPYYRPFKCFI